MYERNFTKPWLFTIEESVYFQHHRYFCLGHLSQPIVVHGEKCTAQSKYLALVGFISWVLSDTTLRIGFNLQR